MTYRILLVGGSSGGHAYPLIAIARSLRQHAEQKNIKLELLALGEGGFLQQATSENTIPFKRIVAGKFRRYLSPLTILDIIKIPISLIQSLWYLFWFMPDAVVSKGGYDSLMPTIAALLYAIPVYAHESDAVPGLANRIEGKFAKMIFLGFERTAAAFPGRPTMVVGNPVRAELLVIPHEQGLSYFKLDPTRKTILIFGGSQGAKQLNDLVLNSLVQMLQHENYQIIHQCGQSQVKSMQAEIDRYIKEGEGSYATAIQSQYRLYALLSTEQMAHAYAAADMIVSRAGSGSLFEIAALGKPAVIVPLPGHQFANATEFAKYGGVMLEGANITPHILFTQITSLLEPERYAAVSQQIKTFARPNAADQIATTILG